jgi:PAS domain S-box-containing protein
VEEHRHLIQEAARGTLYPGYETKRMRKDGSIFDVSIWSAFLENEKGERDSFLAMIMDISHKKKAQQALMENMEFLEITLNSIGDAVITTDIESRVLQMNPIAEKLTGWSIEEAKFKPLESVFHIINAVTEEQMESPVKKVIEKGVIQGLANNTALISRTGETYQIADSAAPIRKSSGEILGAVLVFRDVTEKYIADAKIKASLMEKEVLLREVHHRVKNNLQILYSLLILQEDSVQDKAALKVLQDSQSRVQSMALIHKKLYQAEDLRNINLREYTEELVGELASTYARQNQNISIEIDAEPVPVNVDTAIPCGLILNELISNALKYAFPDNRTGKVEIRIVSYDQEILLVVRDNGVGFPDKVHYDKVSESIGLNLVETLSQQLNGTVIFKQSNGTEVTVRFPFPSV